MSIEKLVFPLENVHDGDLRSPTTQAITIDGVHQ